MKYFHKKTKEYSKEPIIYTFMYPTANRNNKERVIQKIEITVVYDNKVVGNFINDKSKIYVFSIYMIVSLRLRNIESA